MEVMSVAGLAVTGDSEDGVVSIELLGLWEVGIELELVWETDGESK
jgi:hypothetical protein